MKKKLTLSLLAAISFVFAIDISTNTNEINFGNVNVGSSQTQTIELTNNSNEAKNVSIVSLDNIALDQTSYTINPNSTQNIVLRFEPETNVSYNDVIFVMEEDSTPEVLPIKVVAGGRLSDSRYNSTFNKYDEDLKSSLRSIINNHHDVGYSQARVKIFGYIDNDNGRVRCVYTNNWHNVRHGSTPDWNVMNTEHTWPQSMGAEGDARSDLHHLFPTESNSNSVRGNLPFGIVTNPNWSNGGSKRGSGPANTTVFEPRDDHKGDVARSMYYFSLRYNNPNNFIARAGQENVFRQWNQNDPVSSYEQYRNNQIENIQGKPNPFVDHPEFINRIQSFSSSQSRPTAPEYFSPLTTLDFGDVLPREQVDINLYIENRGNANLTVNSITSSDPNFYINTTVSSIPANSFGVARITFSPGSTGNFNSSLTINTNNGNHTVTAIGTSGATSSDDAIVSKVNILTAGPNPFNPYKQRLRIKSTENKIAIYNVKGQKINSLKVTEKSASWNGKNFGGSLAPSGIYFLKGKHTLQRIMLIK